MAMPLLTYYKSSHLNRCLVEGNTLLRVYSIRDFSRKFWGFLFPSLYTVYPFIPISTLFYPHKFSPQKHSMAAISCFLRLRHSSPSSKVRIGSGSFGEIYLGTNLQTNEEVAIKFCVIASSSSLACLIVSSTHS
ncbi:uncharacterized protein LOC105767124 isoform X2 [Gossypium raimondii]|uniref:uncharacterized protein LOC105767124 isoform X2 n=1 Tax=Gossypium raimondii TaxID=29730 RepID=UPI00227BBF20|nr:uncharacterized protein LOC105767124 isoform X2 [Gossypium raimondii]XP_052482422.1 uncharacterized protein LOC105767124 isoform X2 [Gossypium raimondii]